MTLYIVKMVCSNDMVVEDTKIIDERTREIRLRYDKETREKIAAVRNRYKRLAYTDVVHFHGLNLVAEERVPEIREVVKEADRAMKTISPELYAKLIEIPLGEEVIRQGKLYEQIYYAILAQMSKEILRHVERLKSDMPTERTKKNLIKLIDSFERLNIIGDRRINQQIEGLKQITNMRVSEIKDTIMKDLDYVLGEIEKLF